MTTDRNVSLRMDVGHQTLTDTSAQRQSDTPRQATPENRDAFLKAMQDPARASGPDSSDTPTQTRDSQRDDMLPRGIPPVPMPPAASGGVGPLESTLQQGLCESLERLLVSDEDSRQEVRMDLRDEALPGVSVRIFEDQGRLNVCFICAVDTVRRRLDAAISELAQQLADRLQRDVLLQVQTDDPEDLRLNEVVAGPQG